MISKKPVNLSLDFELIQNLKKKRINLSKYVEKLILKDLAAIPMLKNRYVGVGGSNPSRPIINS
ncbi:type II toxin-antitoxin system CcdA family antitoxin [Candidatus Woesearchaeota archaeon]|nr:type II toxin-antitoxin system CcdA family antitoxin [Candidatus Woesearchaeota archaeon]